MSAIPSGFRHEIKSTGKMLFAFVLGSVPTVVVAYRLIPMQSLGRDSWKMAAAFMGTYIGRADNYVAISKALGVSPSVLAAGLAADNVIYAASRRYPSIAVTFATALPMHSSFLVPAGEAMALILMQVFFAVIGASGSIWNVINTALSIFLFAFIQVTIHMAIVLGLGKLFHFVLKLLLLASNANVKSPSNSLWDGNSKRMEVFGCSRDSCWHFWNYKKLSVVQQNEHYTYFLEDNKMRSNAILRITFLVIFLCWIVLWIMLPTSIYKHEWTPKLKKELNTTYLGGQGTNMVLFTVPIMFLAAFGCVYLHILKKPEIYSKSATKSHRLSFLKRPVVVMPPVGIVTAMELLFAVMFIALLIWSLANYVLMSFRHLHLDKAGVSMSKLKFRSFSLRLGYIANICFAFLFFPVTRGSSILPLVGLTSESSIKYHIWLGHASMVLYVAHSLGFIIYWGMTDQLYRMQEWSKVYVSNVAGVIAFVLAVLMWAGSFPRVRRKAFEVFFYTHHIYTLYLLFYALHVGIAYFCLILPGIFLFLIDRYLRFLQSRQSVRLVSARILPCGTAEMNFSKSLGWNYHPDSSLFINVPSISKLQWHPFTVTSSCNLEMDLLSIVVKSEGSWSQKLYQELSSADHLEVSVEGPYGHSSSHFLGYELLVMVSGGSGITPFISIIREIIYLSTQPNCHVPQLILICAFKNSADLSMLDLLLPLCSASLDLSKLQLQIEAYITREKDQPTADSKKLVRTVWFKPKATDSAISPVLGPNSWLWLGAIIVSSFAMFLLFLGILTRYYIYPIDHNTDKMYHYSGRVLWDIFFVFVCIFVSASVLFILAKKQNNPEHTKIQNVQVPIATTSPGSWFHGTGNEVESHPSQSLVEATNIHLGARPDLKKLLLERKESDVGVLVSGPREMRHEVAKICASGLANNLQFDSMSFNF